MKKLIAFVLVTVCVLSLIGCGQQSEQNTEAENVEPYFSIPEFSYAEESGMLYVVGEPGVKTSGFVNTTETDITFENVSEHAKNECTVTYDSVAIYRDTAECVWKVHFYTHEALGGDQTVYLDDDGKTLLIVYGE